MFTSRQGAQTPPAKMKSLNMDRLAPLRLRVSELIKRFSDESSLEVTEDSEASFFTEERDAMQEEKNPLYFDYDLGDLLLADKRLSELLLLEPGQLSCADVKEVRDEIVELYAQYLLDLGIAVAKGQQYVEGLWLLQKVFTYSKNLSTEDKAVLNQWCGVCALRSDSYHLATDYFEQSQFYYNNTQQLEKQLSCLLMGLSYYKNREYDIAEKTFRDVLRFFAELSPEEAQKAISLLVSFEKDFVIQPAQSVNAHSSSFCHLLELINGAKHCGITVEDVFSNEEVTYDSTPLSLFEESISLCDTLIVTLKSEKLNRNQSMPSLLFSQLIEDRDFSISDDISLETDRDQGRLLPG